MNKAKKPAEKKVDVAAASAENKTTAPAAEAVKTETKPAVKTAAGKTAAKADKKPAAKKPAAKRANAKTAAADKPAAKTAPKAAAKKTSTAAKTTKTAAKTAKAPAKEPAKRGPRKAKTVTIEDICAKLEKKVGKAKTAVKDKVAVDIEVWGFEDGSNSKMYIEINEGKVTVSPHTYEAKDFRVSLSCANAVAFVEGKLTLKALVESKDFYAEGNIAAAAKLASIF